ncbi:hypothetical protein HRG_014850 [Hirsutella rhossiliensis]
MLLDTIQQQAFFFAFSLQLSKQFPTWVCCFAMGTHLLNESAELHAACQRATRAGPLRILAAARPYAANEIAHFNALD